MKTTASGIFWILLTIMLAFTSGSQAAGNELLTRIENSVDFLVYSQFNKILGLCREAPRVANNSYWLVSDNLWAWKALKMANESDLSNAAEAGATAEKIRARLIELAVQYDLPTDADGLPKSYAHEAVIGNVALPPYRTETDCTLYRNDYVLNITMRNGKVMSDWTQYADLLLYAALSYHWQGNDTEAASYYRNVVRMWNETSKGLQDKAVKKTYDTYKLALLLYTSRALGKSLAFESELVDRIYAQQRESDGGIVTNYFANGTLEGDANTETTSISIIALLTPSRARLGTFAFYYPWYGTLELSGYWRHWNDSKHDPNNIADERRDIAASDYPLLGVYDSNNESLIKEHINMANQAGIDGFIVSWWGKDSFEDKALSHVRNVCEENDFTFTIYYEDTSSVNQTVDDITYLLDNYSNSKSWYRIDGRPVIYVYKRARNELNPQAWQWHACNDSIGIEKNNESENAATQWLLSEDMRKPPRYGIIPIQPFKNTVGYVEIASPVYLWPNDKYWLNAGISDIRNDSETWSDVGFRIKIENETQDEILYDQIVNFTDGWLDLTFPISDYAGQNVSIRVESYNGGRVNWSSEWAAVDYLYINNSKSEIVSPDPFFDNGWKTTVDLGGDLGGENKSNNESQPYIIMDFGGFENKADDFLDYFQDGIDGLHLYNPIDYSEDLSRILDVYNNASEFSYSRNKTFLATIMPGFNNTAIQKEPRVVDRRDGRYYALYWFVAKTCSPDGYVITSFNEWHEGTEIEPSKEYGYQYIYLTRRETIPEFSLLTFLPLFMMVAILVVTIYRRKRAWPLKKEKAQFSSSRAG